MKPVRLLFAVALLIGLALLPISAVGAAPRPTPTSAKSIGKLLATLNDPAAIAADEFGVSVAVSGTTAVVGSYGNQSAAGTAYIYTKGRSHWNTQPSAILHDPTGATGDLFGISVAVSGTTVVVGAIIGNGSRGAAYIYTEGTAGWPTTPTETLQDPAGVNSDSFGKSLAISGNTLLVGAHGTDSNTGAAYIYTKGTVGWPTTPTETLHDPAGSQGDLFGYWTAVSGSTAVVGALGTNSERGAAYIYSEGTTGWPTTPTATLNDPAATINDGFGYSVAVSGSTVVVGATPGNGTGIGTAYIYSEGTTGWPTTPTATLNDPAATSGDEFGLSVTVSGSVVVVGGPGTDSGTGAAYIYTEGTVGWPTTPTITLHPPTGDVTFGYSLAESGTTALVGEPNGRSGPGAAYIYET